MSGPKDSLSNSPNENEPRKAVSTSGRSPVSPEEGADLIRAFLRIERESVRAAVLEFVKRLSEENL